MQERRYRPGDVLDDYCPRERRITDHAIVAMIEDAIQRTRCGSCDAEHEYKGGRVPPRKKPAGPVMAMGGRAAIGIAEAIARSLRLEMEKLEPETLATLRRPATAIVMSLAEVERLGERALLRGLAGAGGLRTRIARQDARHGCREQRCPFLVLALVTRRGRPARVPHHVPRTSKSICRCRKAQRIHSALRAAQV